MTCNGGSLWAIITATLFREKKGVNTVKVIRASLKRLPNGECGVSHLGHMTYITSVVQKTWGAEYTLVSADGYEIARPQKVRLKHFVMTYFCYVQGEGNTS